MRSVPPLLHMCPLTPSLTKIHHIPSTAKQKLLVRRWWKNMLDMAFGARMDEFGYVYGTIPGDPSPPTIALIAPHGHHPDASGANVRARIVEYTGEDIS